MAAHTILMVGPLPPQFGGMETFLGDLLKSDLSQRFQIIPLNISKPAIKKSSRFKAPMGYAGSFKRNPLTSATSYALSVLFFIKYLVLLTVRHIDLVHIHSASYTSFWEKSIYILTARVFRKKVILHVHGAMFSEFYQSSKTLARWLIRCTLQRCHRIIVLSQSWKEFFRKILPAEKLSVIPNGIDLKPFLEAKGEKTVIPSILFLGEVGRRKGVYDLLQAAKILHDRNIDCRWYVAGPGEIDEAKSYAGRLGLEKEVEFLGPQTGADKVQLLARSWIFVLPSYAEGLPIVVIEAMVSGLPVIAGHVGGIPEMVTEGENGFLIQPGNVNDLADKIAMLLSDKALIQGISQNNQKAVEEKYGISACAKRIGRIYEDVSGGARMNVQDKRPG
jgi:glycosyltransferase involved in cell wall biosynthesis